MTEGIIAVIQAGGLGTRIQKLTKGKIPKPMLPLNGKPMMQWQVEHLKEYGISEIVLIIGHLGELIQDYFGDGSSLGIDIHYIFEREPLGSAGSLFYLKRYPAKRYLLVFGDVMFDMDIERWIRFHKQMKALITLAVHPNSHPYDSDLVVLDDEERVEGFLWKDEKREGWASNCVNAGLFLIENEALAFFSDPEKVDMEKEFISSLLDTGRIYGYRTSEYIKDVGTPDRFFVSAEEQRKGIWGKRNLKAKQKSIFIDRDGTLNRLVGLVSQTEQLELLDNAGKAIRMINESGYLAILVTNQPVVARGLCEESDVRLIHKKLETMLGEEGAYLDDIIFCPHHPDRGYPEENPAYKIECDCRKPKPGMLFSMMERYNIDLGESYMVGDSTSDIQTGINAGTKTVLVHTGESGMDGKYDVSADFEADDLLEAVKLILGRDSDR